MKGINLAKNDPSRLDDESLETAFTDAFQKIVSKPENKLTIEDFECKVERTSAGRDVAIQITIFSMAGGTPRSVLHNKKTGKIASQIANVPVDVEGTQVVFALKDSAELNSNDYILFYNPAAKGT